MLGSDKAPYFYFCMRISTFIKLFLILAIISGCKDENIGNIPPVISSEKLSFTSAGGAKYITLDSNDKWEVVSALPQWVMMDLTSGEKGSYEIKIKIQENSSDESRLCVVNFTSPAGSVLLGIYQSSKEYLNFESENDIKLLEKDTTICLDVNMNVSYNFRIEASDPTWIEQEDDDKHWGTEIKQSVINDEKLNFNISRNLSTEIRTAKIIISNDRYNLSDSILIIQEGSDIKYYNDGECITLQEASKGKGVNLFIMGDGFTIDDLGENGRYEKIMKQAMENFFSIEPYITYRDYFSVYAVVAESETDNVGEGDTKFQTEFGAGTAIMCDDETVFEYVRKVKNIPDDKPVTVIVPLNIDRYAGTAYLYADGNSIALCPMSDELPPNDFEGIIHHEAGGHAFGLLCDEYVYYDKEMPQSRVKEIKEWQELGFYHNLDFTDDLEIIRWKDFVGHAKYSDVGAFEGGYEYQYGVWRSEENSCMNNNIPYFNVQSRWSIVKRIMTISGTDFSISDFMENDVVNKPVGSRSENMPENFIPLGEPVMIKNMK